MQKAQEHPGLKSGGKIWCPWGLTHTYCFRGLGPVAPQNSKKTACTRLWFQLLGICGRERQPRNDNRYCIPTQTCLETEPLSPLNSQGTDKHTSSGAWIFDNFLTGEAHLVRWAGIIKGQGQRQLHRKVCNGRETVHGLCHQVKCWPYEGPCFPSWAEIGEMECLRIFTVVPTPNTIRGLLAVERYFVKR